MQHYECTNSLPAHYFVVPTMNSCFENSKGWWIHNFVLIFIICLWLRSIFIAFWEMSNLVFRLCIYDFISYNLNNVILHIYM